VNDAPIDTSKVFTGPEDTTLTNTSLLVGVTDVDSTTFSICNTAITAMSSGLAFSSVYSPGSTTPVNVTLSGTLAGNLAITTNGTLTFKPAPNWNGNFQFNAFVCDDYPGTKGSSPFNVTIIITPGLCICVCMCIYMCVCVHVHVCVHAPQFVSVHVHVCV
jgi:hypothetical protein